jgi:hypothetical protein
MKSLKLFSVLILMCSFSLGQQPPTSGSNPQPTLVSSPLLNDLVDLRNLAIGEVKSPVARAIALIEIGRITWSIDREEAKRSFREAYRLTLPSTAPDDPTQKLLMRAAAVRESIVKTDLRRRLAGLIKSDKEFSTELFGPKGDVPERADAYEKYGILLSKAILANSTDSATDMILSLEDVAPMAVSGLDGLVNEIARTDRAAGDMLIAQILDRLRSTELSREQFPIILGLSRMIEPHGNAFSDNSGSTYIAPPSPQVIRAYLYFLETYFNSVALTSPNTLGTMRPFIIHAADLSSRIAAELVPEFVALERMSRREGDTAWNPSLPADSRSSNEDSDDAFAGKVSSLLSKGDFEKARDEIRQIHSENVRRDLFESVNYRESIESIKKGDLGKGEKLAMDLRLLPLVTSVYTLLIEKNVLFGNKLHAHELMSEVLTRIDTPVDSEKPSSTSVKTERGQNSFDPRLAALNKLTRTVKGLDESLQLQFLDAMVAAANRSALDTSLGITGIDYELFGRVALGKPEQARKSALDFQDPLRRILALSSIADAKAKQTKTKPQPSAR